ncbi:hypothetical protein C8Q77DRAFT_1155042 [Trametes polyzona]|nr:hypothetical protein C8Q77DRAFT_1155042 [Trametes polyzona]
MFDRVFGKKEEPTYTTLARRARVDKQKAAEYAAARRPRTAPASSGTASAADSNETNRTLPHRRSLGDGSMSPHRAMAEPLRFSSPEPLAPFSFLPPPTQPLSPEAENPAPPSPTRHVSPCPRMVPQRRESSVEIRNPFRSDTADSVGSMGRTESFDSFADTGVPVHRTVRAFRPAQTMGDASHIPHKAAIFTAESTTSRLQAPPSTVNAVSDPFTDSHVASQPPSPSVSVASSPVPRDQTSSPRLMSRPWSLLRSPKRESQDFLQVKIPTGIMSPVRESRLSFWSKA